MTGRTRRPVMVVHGPEPFDSGETAALMERIRPSCVLVAGVMAQTAAEESGIPCECPGSAPSVVLREAGRDAFLLNHAKSPESGRIFGEIIAGRLGSKAGLVQVEFSENKVLCWNMGSRVLAAELADTTGFEVEFLSAGNPEPTQERMIRGCIPGEAVMVDGIVIGTATSEMVVLMSRDGRLCPVSGLDPKAHGFEKLHRRGPVDAGQAWCKSGSLRRRGPKQKTERINEGRILVVDHCGCDLYRRLGPGVCGVLSIGDDTTAVCTHICAHLGIPVFGITDGDADGVVGMTCNQGSVIVEVLEGRDDDLGMEIAAGIDGEVLWDNWAASTLSAIQERVRVVYMDGSQTLC